MALEDYFNGDNVIKLTEQMEMLRNIVHEELQNAIQRYVYDAYDPKEWDRTYEFLNSVTSTDVTFDGNELSFEVRIDRSRIHKSVVDGGYTYVAPLLDLGHVEKGYESDVDYFHNYPPTHFWDKFIEEVKRDIAQALPSAVMKVYTTKKYR